ncbi:AAA family ATPase [Pseudoalteromonas sp. XMcav1-K]|uniref:nuclease-related domain-containing DEAD/DEAH box helicase n=1 Tax=Pseudoalteromonas sp. XMcav1-K TaxID=3374372 RepID=UPI003757FC34
MAILYPSSAPRINESPVAEPLVYRLLKEQLDDSFHIIHSVPWLSSFITDVLKDKSYIGEVDFLVLNKDLGVLAIEVKGGILKHDKDGYYYSRDSGLTISRIDPVSQLNRGVFVLQKWFKDNGIKMRIGRAFCFPESVIPLKSIPPGYQDFNEYKAISLVLDKKHIHNFGQRIIDIMVFHKESMFIPELSEYQLEKIIEMIAPTVDAAPCWISRINSDNYLWLKLTDEQNECVNDAIASNKLIVNGWPGSGKTVVAVQAARKLSSLNKRVLTITYNRLLADKLRAELIEHKKSCDVFTLHKLAWEIDEKLNSTSSNGSYTYEVMSTGPDLGVTKSIEAGVKGGFFDQYDCLIVDEGQVIWKEVWQTLLSVFDTKKIIVMCDATQAFEYESPVSLEWLESILSIKAFTLTNSLRVPKKVCDRLKLFTKPSYTVQNPREYESDTLSELVVASPKHSLKQLIERLISDGIPPSYITVLKPTFLGVPESLVPAGVNIENIGKFRGLESPIIIIYADHKMTNTEFFVAYSRATSKCIAIFEAFHVKNGSYGVVGPDLYSNNTDSIDKEVSRSLTSQFFAELNFNNISIYDGLPVCWCHEWNSYVLIPEQGNREVTKSLFEIFLRSELTPEIFTWSKNSRRTLSLIPSEKYDLDRPFSDDLFELKPCLSCEVLTPHSIATLNGDSCLLCSKDVATRDTFFEENLKKLGCVLTQEIVTTKDERAKLDASLYIVGAFNKLQVIRFSEDVISAINHVTKGFNRLALAYALCYLYMRHNKRESRVKIKDVTDATRKWNTQISEWNRQSWNAYINDAFRVLEKFNLIESEKNGWRKMTNLFIN